MAIFRGNEQFIKEGKCKTVIDGRKLNGRLSLTNERLMFEKEEGLFSKSRTTELQISLGLVSRVEVEGMVFKSVRVEATWIEQDYGTRYGLGSGSVSDSGADLVTRRNVNYVFQVSEAEQWASDIRRAVQQNLN